MELTIENLIKIVMGVIVVGLVVFGIYTFFRDYVIEFFKTGNETAKLMIPLIK